jgi:hypothetical protein
MNAVSTRELWAKLSGAGLTTGAMPEPGDAYAPWYVRVMLGIAGWIAALFLLGFIGAAFEFVIHSKTASVAVGFMLIAGAYAGFRAAPRGDFISMFSLATSFAGQALVIFGLGIMEDARNGMPWTMIAAIEALLALLMPNFMHRVVSAYVAGVALAYALAVSGANGIAVGVVAAAVAVVWLNEIRLGTQHAVVAAIGYGLTLALIQIECTSMLENSVVSLFGARAASRFLSQPWVGEALAAAALLGSAWALLRNARGSPSGGRRILALAATAALGAASFKAPGVAGGLMIVLLGFANGNRVLTGLGIAASLFALCGYYYRLDATLLVKSGVLAATGATLLAVRWLVLRMIMPREAADA